MFKLSP